MSEIKKADLVAQVAREIEALLAHVEREVGRPIETAELTRIEITTFKDAEPKYLRQFTIRMTPPPGAIGSDA